MFAIRQKNAQWPEFSAGKEGGISVYRGNRRREKAIFFKVGICLAVILSGKEKQSAREGGEEKVVTWTESGSDQRKVGAEKNWCGLPLLK